MFVSKRSLLEKMDFFYVQSDEPNRWHFAHPWQEKLISMDQLLPKSGKNVVVSSLMKDLLPDEFPKFTVNDYKYDPTEDILLAERLLARIAVPDNFVGKNFLNEISHSVETTEETGRLSRRQRRRLRENAINQESFAAAAFQGPLPATTAAPEEPLPTASASQDESAIVSGETRQPSSWSSLFSGMFVKADAAGSSQDPPKPSIIDHSEKIKELLPRLNNAFDYCFGHNDYNLARLYMGICRLTGKLQGQCLDTVSYGYICNLRTGTARIYLKTSLQHAEVEAKYSHDGTTTLSPSTLGSMNLFA